MTRETAPLFLAPMAGVTDLAYRLLARECGADVTVTEFTAASGLTRRNTHSWLKVESDPREKPFIPQIFGGIIEEMVQTVELLQDRADTIDINFGCPAPKVCRNDAGAALLRDPDRVVEMVRACLDVAEVPITVKVRLGTGGGPNTALEVAKRLEVEGIERICVHGRTLSRGTPVQPIGSRFVRSSKPSTSQSSRTAMSLMPLRPPPASMRQVPQV